MHSDLNRHRAPSKQRGAAALAVALVLLFGMTLVAFFANRGQIFEQRTSANQYRSTRAFEMAEAGLEWAVARMNDDAWMIAAPSCSTTGALVESYGERYLDLDAGGFNLGAMAGVRSGCSIAANGATTCSCPADNASLNLGAAENPRFSVTYTVAAGDPWAIEVTSFGCTSAGAFCGDAAGTPDAVAVVRAVYKMKPAVPNAPGAGLVTGAAASTGGNLFVHNLDMASNGITINSGTTIELGGSTDVTTLPGTPPRASVLDNDPSLIALTQADANGDIFFASFFGETMAEFKNNPKTWLITSGACGANPRCTQCATDSSCGTAVSTAYDKGFNRFWSDTDVKWTNNLPTAGTLGTADLPIIVASSEEIKLSSNLTAYGMFYAATATVTEEWTFTGSGSAKVFGAFISRGSFDKGAGTLDLIYDANIFKPENLRGVMVRVPGSWRDKTGEY
jgi:Tfp pilus assembly protein PilX